MTTPSFFWHDYETFGIDPMRDRPCQFAGVRTDAALRIIDEPVMAYCQLAADYLPHPEACLITGITPQRVAEQGVSEAAFAAVIHQQLAQPGTCGIGYNSLRFDDEVTRHLLYRNFYDAYGREWQHGNSRWDMLDVARAARALRPEGIVWPNNAEGKPSLRLEDLTVANGISHQAAHDALSDVYATLDIARLIRAQQPRLYDYLQSHRSKSAAEQLLALGSFTPLVHVSGRYPGSQQHLAVIVALARHPRNSNEVIVYDLSVDPSALLSADAASIQQRLFTASADLPEGVTRFALKTVHINKAPVLVPLNTLRPQDRERLGLVFGPIQQHLEALKNASALPHTLSEVFTRHFDSPPEDPEWQLYSGGFFSTQDKALMQQLQTAAPQQLASFAERFKDPRLPEMLFRYRARNYPDSLSASERAQWQAHCSQRLQHSPHPHCLDWTRFKDSLQQLAATAGQDHPMVQALQQFALDQRG